MLPTGLNQEIFKQDGTGDSIVKGVMGFTAWTKFTDTGFEIQACN